MDITHCEKCSKPIQPRARPAQGKALCAECSSATAAPVLKFYFCEKCGKRVTDVDLQSGAGRDKKLKGVYCNECSVGVTTMEFDAIKESDLAAARPPTPPAGSKATPKPHDRQNVKIAPDVQKPARIPAAPLLSGLALLIIVTVALVLMRSPRHPEAVAKSETQTPAVPAPSPLTPPPSDPIRESTSQPDRPVDTVQKTPETQAPSEDSRHASPPDGSAKVSTPVVPAVPQVVDDRKDTAPTDSNSGKPQQPATPTAEIDHEGELLSNVVRLLAQHQLPQALSLVDSAADASKGMRSALRSAIEAIQKDEKDFQDALAACIGKDVKLETAKEKVAGKLAGLEYPALRVEKNIVVDGQSIGSSAVRINAGDLTAACRQSIFPPPTSGSKDAWAGRALESLSAGRLAECGAALARCEDSLLVEPLKKILAARQVGELEVQAEAKWAQIEADARGSSTQLQARTLQDKIAAYEKQYGYSAWAQATPHAERRAVLRTELDKLVLGLDPKILRSFRGKILSYDPKTQRLEVEYDFKDDAQKEDFDSLSWKGLKIEKHELVFPFYYSSAATPREHFILRQPRFYSGDVTVTLDFKIDPKPTGPLISVYFGVPELKPIPGVACVSTDGTHFNIAPQLPYFWMDTKNGEKIIVAEPPMPLTGAQYEVSCRGNAYTAKVNGKVVLEFSRTEANTNQGVSVLTGNGHTTRVKSLKISGRLDPRWMAQIIKDK